MLFYYNASKHCGMHVGGVMQEEHASLGTTNIWTWIPLPGGDQYNSESLSNVWVLCVSLGPLVLGLHS